MLPSVLMVNGESPSLLAENWPPKDVIKKQRVKNPMPTTNILNGEKERRHNQKHYSWAIDGNISTLSINDFSGYYFR